jgi:type I restriction enzyme S subunit
VRAALGRNMTAVRPRTIPASFLIQFLLSPHMYLEVQKKQDFGAIMGALNVRAIYDLAITVPNDILLKKFDDLIAPTRRKIWNLIDKSEILSLSRDLLLSRLITGKLSVEDLDIKFPPSMRSPEPVEGREADA